MLPTSPTMIAWNMLCGVVSKVFDFFKFFGGAFWAGMFFGVLIGCYFVTFMAAWGGELPDQWHKAAVERGAGEWYVDDERQVRFRWKPLPEKNK